MVLLCGLAFAVLISIIEFCYHSRRYPITQMNTVRQSLCSEMTEEFWFAMKCRGSRQRPALRRQCSKCIPTTTPSIDLKMHQIYQPPVSIYNYISMKTLN